MFKIYVGNLSFDTTELALEDSFAEHGKVASVQIITDRDTGRSRGFGFVEMHDPEEGQKAMDALNGADLDGRALRVNEATPREPRGGGGGGGRRGGGGGDRRGGGGGGGYNRDRY